jgi:zinc protease
MTVSVRPLPARQREYHFPRFSRHLMPNGMRVIIAPVRKLPVVTVLSVVDAGASADAKGMEGLAQLTAEMLREGTSAHNGIEILEGFESLGTSLEAGADWDSTVVSMTLLQEHLMPGLLLLAEVLTSASFPEHEVERLRAERLAERLQILSEPRGLADESFSRFLYAPGSRYAEPIGGTSESIAAIKRSDVVEFFRLCYVPEAVTLIIVGDIDTDEGLLLVNEAFGKWQGRRASAAVSITGEARNTRALEVITKPDAAQAELRLGHLGISRLFQRGGDERLAGRALFIPD